jgi:hypothetical protein
VLQNRRLTRILGSKRRKTASQESTFVHPADIEANEPWNMR